MNIDQEVREMLNAKVRNAPGMNEPPQPVMRRARTRRVMNGVGVTFAVLLIATGSVIGARSLGKTGTIEPAVPGTGKVVPWEPIGPGTLPGQRSCHATVLDLAADAGGAPGLILSAKDDRADCAVLGTFSVRLYDSAGKQLNVRVLNADSFRAAILNDPRISQMLVFEWGNGCAPSAGPIRYDLDLPFDGGTLSTTATRLGEGTLVDPTSCDGNRTATTMTFVGVTSEEAGPPYKNAIDNLGIELSQVPSSVAAGSVLRYAVTLINRTQTAISLIECPLIEQRLQVSRDRHEVFWNRLNCDAAPAVILPGSSVTFAMEIPVPGDAWQPPEVPMQTPLPVQAVFQWRFWSSARSGDTAGVLIGPAG